MRISKRFGFRTVRYQGAVSQVEWHYRVIGDSVHQFGRGYDSMDKMWRIYREKVA